MYYKKWEKGSKKNQQNLEKESEVNSQQNDEAQQISLLEQIKSLFNDCADSEHKTYRKSQIEVIYLSSLIDGQKLETDIINPISRLTEADVLDWIEAKEISNSSDIIKLKDEILSGSVLLFFQEKAYYYNVYGPEKRGIDKSETETVVVGAHDAFVEDITINLSLVRRRIKNENLKVIKLEIGEVTKSDVYLLYMSGIANDDLVLELKSRIEKIKIDAVYDTNMLGQLIDEMPDSLFPQYYNTELPDVVRSKLVSGKLAILLEGSPTVLCAPSSFFEFIQSPDDYNQRWLIGTSLRLLRTIAIFVTLTFTALYVAVTTYHYEVLPENILITIAESRAKVPFPPLVEALLMEMTIELLREAGARLPTKVGQTIGIVGGIVIGQAAVEAGLTSNILIIAVASSAIASFVLPSYNMSNAIRIVRFFLILLSGYLGVFGIFVGIAILLIHTASLTSLKTPYLIPVAPLFFREWLDTFMRGPYWALKKRPAQSKTDNNEMNKMKQ